MPSGRWPSPGALSRVPQRAFSPQSAPSYHKAALYGCAMGIVAIEFIDLAVVVTPAVKNRHCPHWRRWDACGGCMLWSLGGLTIAHALRCLVAPVRRTVGRVVAPSVGQGQGRWSGLSLSLAMLLVRHHTTCACRPVVVLRAMLGTTASGALVVFPMTGAQGEAQRDAATDQAVRQCRVPSRRTAPLAECRVGVRAKRVETLLVSSPSNPCHVRHGAAGILRAGRLPRWRRLALLRAPRRRLVFVRQKVSRPRIGRPLQLLTGLLCGRHCHTRPTLVPSP